MPFFLLSVCLSSRKPIHQIRAYDLGVQFSFNVGHLSPPPIRNLDSVRIIGGCAGGSVPSLAILFEDGSVVYPASGIHSRLRGD